MEKIKEIKIREIVEVFEDYIYFTEETKFLTKNQVQKPRVCYVSSAKCSTRTSQRRCDDAMSGLYEQHQVARN